MFKPNFKITPKMVNFLTDIAEDRAIIFDTSLIPKWENQLRKESIIQSTHSSTAIEGNRLSLEQVAKLFSKRKLKDVSFKDQKEVENYFTALNYLDKFKMKDGQKVNITEKDILSLHKIITDGVMSQSEQSGRYRTGNSATQEVIFTPPNTKDVPNLMKDLINWINSKEIGILSPIIKAGIVHYEFVRIHPFIDGNGRIGRILATLTLEREGFDCKGFFTLDDFYWAERPRYYKMLNQVNKETLDLTEWLEYICEGAKNSIRGVKEKILLYRGDKDRKFTAKQVIMNERIVKVIGLIKKRGSVTNRYLQKELGITNVSVYSLLEYLLKKQLIKKIGRARSVSYLLNQPQNISKQV